MAVKSKLKVLRLALKDLQHEWILTLCMIMAISAVLAPLLLLFGLKYGIIDLATDRMINDPMYRAILPNVSKTFDKNWFNNLRQREDVSFVIPMTREISATVKAQVNGQKEQQELNIIPTANGDPLLLENGAAIPAKDECVMTKFAAESLGAKIGDVLVTKAGRIIKGRYEYATLKLKISGILTERASQQKSIYVQLPVLEAVEKYKDGQSVPEYGWNGSIPTAYPLFDGVIVILPEKLTKFQQLSLCNNTGFTKIETLDKDKLQSKTGYLVAPGMAAYRLYTLHKPAGMESIKGVKNKLRGKNALLFPWTKPCTVQLLDKNKSPLTELSLFSLTADETHAKAAGLNIVTPWQKSSESPAKNLQIMLPPDLSVDGDTFFLQVEAEGGTLQFPVTIASEKTKSPGVSFVPAQLGGIIRLHQQRNIAYDNRQNEFVLFRKGFASFRLYAKSIYGVKGLRNYFDSNHIPVHTELLAINKVIQLDKGMTLIFWLLAAVGIIGSVASLVSSLYASVERKKRDLSVLRLLGLPSLTLFRFPVYQGIAYAAGGFAISMILFGLFARVINMWFAPYVQKMLGYSMDEAVSFCRIPPLYVGAAFSFTVLVAVLSAMVAAFRVTGIEPAEALRDE